MSEFDIRKIVNDKVQQMQDSGYLQKEIEKSVEKAIVDAIDGYEFRRAIEKEVQEHLTALAKDFGLSAYNQHIMTVVKDVFESEIDVDIREKAKETLDKILMQRIDAYSLSKIIKAYREEIDEGDDYEEMADRCEKNDNNDGFLCKLEDKVHDSGYSKYVLYLSDEGDTDTDDADYIIKFNTMWENLQKGKTTIKDLIINGTQVTRNLIPQVVGTFDKILMNLYINQTPVFIDLENYDEDDHYYHNDGENY